MPVKLDGLFCGVPAWYSVTRGFQWHRPRVQAGGEAVHLPAQAGCLGAAELAIVPPPWLCCVSMISWLPDRLGPVQASGSPNFVLATRQIPVARNTANVTAASAAPDRAR